MYRLDIIENMKEIKHNELWSAFADRRHFMISDGIQNAKKYTRMEVLSEIQLKLD